MDPPGEEFAARLAAIYERLDHPPGVMLGVRRLPILDQVLDDLESVGATALPEPALAGLTRLLELLSENLLGTAPEAIPRRLRIVELLRIADGGRLPSLAADDGDAFGAELRAMLASDDALRVSLGRLHPLVMGATSVAPSGRSLRGARALAAGPDGPRVVDATRRSLAALVRAPIESRPDILVGGLRPMNQRLARGMLWFAAQAFPDPAETLGLVGLRMGTSGRRDAVVRDVALANTCAALLGQSADPAAPAALVSMLRRVTNRNVLKQVARSLEAVAGREGRTVDDVIDESLPAFELDRTGRREIDAGGIQAQLAVREDGRVGVWWRAADGAMTELPPMAMEVNDPSAVASVAATVAAVDAALAEERGALELRLGSVRSWPEPVVRRRFLEHPISGVFSRRLVWAVDGQGSSLTVLLSEDAWIGPDERPVPDLEPTARRRLWHPAESSEALSAAWRATLAARTIRQPFPQVDREIFLPAAEPAQADVRFAGRIVDHARLRALLRERHWAVPALGAWDQGDEATAWRAFDDGLRAELRYQAPERGRTGERVERARLVAVRFVRTDAPAASPASDSLAVPVLEVPRRVFSEALRDLSLAVVVGEVPTP